MSEQVQMTEVEFELAKKAAAQEQAISMLGANIAHGRDETNKVLSKLDSNIGRLREEIQKWPDRINKCRDDIEDDMEKIHRGFMTHTDGELMEQRLKNEFQQLRTQVKQTVITVVAVASIAQFFLLSIVLYLQIAEKL